MLLSYIVFQYFKEEVEDVLAHAILQSWCYNISSQLWLFLKEKKTKTQSLFHMLSYAKFVSYNKWIEMFSDSGLIITVFPSLSTSFSVLVCSLKFGCGLLLL